MFSLNPIQKRYGAFICRRCINRIYKAHLEPEDCIYGYYFRCPKCKEDHHIVVDLTPGGHFKMLLK